MRDLVTLHRFYGATFSTVWPCYRSSNHCRGKREKKTHLPSPHCELNPVSHTSSDRLSVSCCPGAAQTVAQVTVSLSHYFHISCTFQDLLPGPPLLSAAFWTLLAGSTSARRLVWISGISSWVSPLWDIRGRSGGSSADVFLSHWVAMSEPCFTRATKHSPKFSFF